MAPRKRERSAKLPHGIKGDALPPYVYWDPSGNGRWMWRYRDEDNHWRSKRIAGPMATLREIWDVYEASTRETQTNTLRDLVSRFEASPQWSDLGKLTQRDYQFCAAAILETTTKAGLPLADTNLSDWTPGTVRAYCDRRAEHSRSRANHELRYLRRLFSWAHERDIIASNPARGVKALKEPPRQRYVQDGEYAAFLEFAGPRYPYLVPIVELAYLCRLRLSEVLDLKRADVREDGLYAARRKGSKDALTGWSSRLRAAVDCALALHGQIASLYVIPGADRGRLKESTVQTAWQRSMTEWAARGNERWTLHDAKRKGVSDVDGDKLAASGHRSSAMLRVYDVLPSKAPATR